MKCSDLRSDLAVYADGLLPETEAAAVAAHLETCPMCRIAQSEVAELRSSLRRMQRPVMPRAMRTQLHAAVNSERRTIEHSWLPVTSEVRRWLTLQVMPYGVGVAATIILALGLLLMINSSGGRYSQFAAAPGESGILLASNRDPFTDSAADGISPAAFARSRTGVSSESPSINPRGALVALTRSLIRTNMKDDEVVVVADVFSDGLAQIAEVVEPSRDRNAVDLLQKALDSDPAYAPFVPAAMENRPDSMRVVLRFQSVNVNTNLKKINRSKL
jgi:anti-sigma factor RsiW